MCDGTTTQAGRRLTRGPKLRRRCGLAGLVFALLQGCQLAAAVEPGYLVRVWDVEDGLPQSSVTDLAQTSDGYLWIGTLHSGLARFDGHRFVRFDLANTPQLGHPGVRRLFGDSFGRLWVNTFGPGLLVWEGGKFSPVMLPSPQVEGLLAARANEVIFNIASNNLYRLSRDAQAGWKAKAMEAPTNNPVVFYVSDAGGTVWYRRTDGRIGRVLEERFVDLDPVPGLAIAQVRTLQSDREGRIWVGTENCVALWDSQQFTDMTPTNGEPLRGLLRIAPVAQGAVWLETATRMRLCRDRQWVAEARDWDPRLHAPPQGRGRRADAEGGLWIQVADLGLVHLAPDGRLDTVTPAQGLRSTALGRIFADSEGNLWTGYERGGLVCVRPRLFHTVGRAEGLNDTLVASVCADRDGAIWMGTAGGEVSRWQGGVLTNFTLPMLTNRCLTPLVSPAKDGGVWVATDGNGLLAYAEGGFRHVLSPEQCPPAPRAILADRAGRVWVAAFTGLYRLDAGKWELVQTVRSAGDYPGALTEAADGSVWLGTFNSELWHFTRGGMTRLKLPSTGPKNFISALLGDAEGALWIGTQGGGLLRWKDGVFARVTSAEGLPEDRIWELLDDAGGGLWLGTGAGIARLDKSQFDQVARLGGVLTPRRFGPSDGLASAGGTPEFKPNCWRSDDGRLWFTTANGVVTVNPAQVRGETAAPPAIIESVDVSGKVREIPSPAAVPDSSLAVGPGSQSLDFRYTALAFSHPELVRFRHRLEGLDADWISAGENRVATYRHVPPGEYVFRVTACNASGVWNPKPAALRVTVRPHFWQTGWFLGFAIAALAAALISTVRYVSFRRLRARLARLEQEAALQQERARIAKDIHDDLGASLTEIALLSERAQRRIEQPQVAREHIDQIFTKARALTRAIDDIVWSFNPSNDNVEGLVQHLGKFAPEFLRSAGIRCRMDVPLDLPEVPLASRVRHHLYLALKEALHNVVKHAGATEVWVRVEFSNGDLSIRIEDNGRGFTTETAAAADADGLSNMRQRMGEVGGRFEQTSQPGAGTRTKLTVPLPLAKD